ncbi:MAG: CinA family protein [Microbacteriaceae bacterium]
MTPGEKARHIGPENSVDAKAERVSLLFREAGLTVAVAESLTSGNIAGRLGAAEAASEWFLGAVIAYSPRVKFEILGVEPGPVVTPECAKQMAEGIARLTGSDVSVAVTGVGGPEPEESRPPGTVFFAVHGPDGTSVQERHFAGDPASVVLATTEHALQLLIEAME